MSLSSKEPMVEMFILENSQLVKLVEQSLNESIQAGSFEQYTDEIFRIMHVIRGNSSMMLYDNIAILAHHIECVFAYLKNAKPDSISFIEIAKLVSASLDFIKSEVNKIDMGENPDGDPKDIIRNIEDYLISMNGDGNSKAWNTALGEEKSLKPRFYIKSLQNSGDTSAKPHLVKELNLSGTSSQSKDLLIHNKEIKLDEKGNKIAEEDSLMINKDTVFLSVNKLKTIRDLIHELVRVEADTACNEKSDIYSLNFFYKLSERRRKIISDLQDIVVSINTGH